MNLLKKFFLALCGLLVTTAMFAQQRTISGVITDTNNEPLMGVAVILQGNTSVGTMTDLDGRYSITVPSSGAVLEVSCLGFLTKTVPVGQSNVLNVSLEVDNLQLEETVVVGYGTHKKETLTGSIVSVQGTGECQQHRSGQNPRTCGKNDCRICLLQLRHFCR